MSDRSKKSCEHCQRLEAYVPPGEVVLVQDYEHGHLFINGRDISGEIEPGVTIETARSLEENRITVTFAARKVKVIAHPSRIVVKESK